MYSHESQEGIKHYELAQKALEESVTSLSDKLKDTKEILTDLNERIVEMKEDFKIQQEKEKEEELKKAKQTSTSTSEVHVLVPRRKNDAKRKIDEISVEEEKSKKPKVE
jgi:TolA-binding protein